MTQSRPWLWFFLVLGLLSIGCMLYHTFGAPLPDLVVRAAGVTSMATIAATTFVTVRLFGRRRV